MAAELFDDVWVNETTDLCRIVTFTDTVHVLNPRMLEARDYITSKADAFNASQRTVKFSPFQWVTDQSGSIHHHPTDDQVLDAKYYLLGLRLGPENPRYKVAMICHLDTVPATSSPAWDPFEPYVKPDVDYELGQESPQDFLVGRGCIDDKGPAISALIVARALAQKYDGTDTFDDVALEILFDGSEETDMATPKYLEDSDAHPPDFGIVFDAMWCVRAEKGGDRPHFEVKHMDPPAESVYVSSVISNPDNSSNTIPDWAEATFCGDQTQLDDLFSKIKEMYEEFSFDDTGYQRAALEDPQSPQDGKLTIRTLVKGAQHGSSPDENRLEGANPLVSLANFVAGLATDGTVASTSASRMCEMVAWMWGTRVYGENHKDELYGYDEVFTGGEEDWHNGTSYAVTKMALDEDTLSTSLEVDIRYAMAHHDGQWDGWSDGLLDGDHSVLAGRFQDLLRKFNAQKSAMPSVELTNPEEMTLFAPDIRVPDTNENFQKIEQAFQDVVGYPPARLAIGGGTDAKGVLNLLAVGPLFATTMGPPVNYHGIGEGAPIADMRTSTAVLERVMELEIRNPLSEDALQGMKEKTKRGLERLKARGYVHKCNC